MSRAIQDLDEIVDDDSGKDLGFFSRWFNLVFAPEATFQAIQIRPSWFLPMLAIIIFTCLAAFFFFRAELIEDLMYEQLISNPYLAKAPDAQIDKSLWMIKNVTPFMPLVSIPITTFAAAGLIYLVAVIFLGGGTSFKHILSLLCHILLITPFQSLFSYAMVFQAENLHVGTNVTLFLPDLEKTGFLYKFLFWIDLFPLWQLTLLSLGLAFLCKWKPGRVLFFFLLLYLVFAGGFAGIGVYLAKLGAK